MILLDTHVLLWMASGPRQLSKRAAEAIRQARQGSGIAVATITLWELAWLAENGRIQVNMSVDRFVQEAVSRVVLQPMTPAIAAIAARLPESFPRDPADRIIAATAIVEGMPLVTADTRIRQAKMAETVW